MYSFSPLCQINKFGFYFPRRLLRSPILVGYQDCFPALLPESIALLISSPGEYTLLVSLFLFYYAFSSLFVLSLFLFSCVLLILLLLSLFLSCFIFLLYSNIHKYLKIKNLKKLLPCLFSGKLDLVCQDGSLRIEKIN